MMASTNGTTGRRTGRKRGHGEGSITQRKDGRWQGCLMVGYKADGKMDRRFVYGKTRTEVQRKLGELRYQHEQGMLPHTERTRDTVGGYLGRWLEAIKPTVRLPTWERYAILVRVHLVPALGRRKLAALRPDDLQRLYAVKLAAGLSPRTVRYLYAVMRRALGMAVKWGYVPRNVAEASTPPSLPSQKGSWPSPTDIGGLLAVTQAADDQWWPLWTVAAYSGCRQGELLGLRWDDLSLDQATLTVQRTLLGASGGLPAFGEPKTERSRRTITVPPEAVAALRTQRARQAQARLLLGPAYTDLGLVFATQVGRPLLARNVTRAFKVALERAGLPKATRFHDLRHAHATALIAAGVPIPVVSARLGHANAAITLSVYAHVVPGQDADAALRVPQVMRPTG